MRRSMRLRGNLKSLTNSAMIAFLGAIAIALDLLPSLRNLIETLLKQMGIVNDLLVDIVLAVLIGLVLFLLLILVNSVIEKRARRLLMTYHSSLATVMSADSSGDRITDFQILRSQAKDSILVMGIGMTYFSTDLSYLKELLDRGINVRLLMIDPGILVQSVSSCETKFGTAINRELFDEMFVRTGYATDVRTSFERLRRFVEERRNGGGGKGSVELRTFPYLILMNVTMIDENSERRNGEMLIEFCFPFSDSRMRIRVSEVSDKPIFDSLVRDVEELCRKSDFVADDKV